VVGPVKTSAVGRSAVQASSQKGESAHLKQSDERGFRIGGLKGATQHTTREIKRRKNFKPQATDQQGKGSKACPMAALKKGLCFNGRKHLRGRTDTTPDRSEQTGEKPTRSKEKTKNDSQRGKATTRRQNR